ncbi:MAG: DUF748 domain-containing protein [Bacteroidales bacterium]|nr:DUF748 domain-containing protein [Bacteroidales bacterium]
MNSRSFKKGHFVITGIVLFFILILFAAPRIARWYLVKKMPEITGRHLSIDKIRINYFTGTLKINNLIFYEADKKTTFVSFRQLKVNLDYLPLIHNVFCVKYVSLDKPYVQVLQNGSLFNFSDLIPSDSTGQVKDTIAKETTKYIIHEIRITKGFIKYTDIPLDHTISLDSLDLLIPGFTWNSESTNLDVDFRFVDGGGFTSKLALNQADSLYTLNLEIDSLNLGIVEPYIRESLYISSLGGYLSNKLMISGSITSILNLSVSGINHIYNFRLQDTLQRTVLSFNDLTITIDTFQLDEKRISIDSISLKNPFVLVELIDTTNNWLALMKPAPAESPDSLDKITGTPDSTTAFSYNLPHITLSGGTILFSDKTMDYPFEYRIDNLTIESSEASEKPDNISVLVTAGLNGTGTLQSEGIINPEEINEDMDLALEIGQFRMKDVDAYFRHYFGFPVNDGVLNYKTDNKMRPKSLESHNNIYIRKFTLDEKMEAEPRYNIPLRLAIGILSDKDGIIDLKAPVRMKGDEVKIINLGRIIFRTIGNLFIKAAVSPFELLSGLYNVEPGSLQEICMSLTDSIPDEVNLKSVDILADILDKKPQLKVGFIYCINREKAADSLAYLLAVNDYVKTTRRSWSGRESIPDSILIQHLRSKPFAANLPENTTLSHLCRNYAGADKLNAGLDSLRIGQTGFMANYLKLERNIRSERFSIIGTTPDSIRPDVNYPFFKVWFTAD